MFPSFDDDDFITTEQKKKQNGKFHTFSSALSRTTERNVRRHPEDPGVLDVEDGVPPPRAAPPLLR
jgi:hypothetical protein